MSGRQYIIGCITGMMSGAYFTVTSFLSGIFRRTSNHVVGRVEHLAQLHAANKRCKLSPREGSNTSWLRDEVLHDLALENESFLQSLRLVWSAIANHPSRDETNTRLQPLRHVLFDNACDIGFLNRGERDFCDAFHKHLQNCVEVCTDLYGVGFSSGEHTMVPSALKYHFKEGARDKLELARKFLSAPALSTVCNQILLLAATHPQERVTTGFIDRVVLDLRAILQSAPPPSFAVSEVFHKQGRQLFPHPVRTDLDRHWLPPGSFPEEYDEPARQKSGDAPPLPSFCDPPSSSEPESPHPVTAKTKIGKTAPLRADLMESRISEITPYEFRSEFYHECEAHDAIQDTCFTDFEHKEQPNLTKLGESKSILKNRQRQKSKRSPKRLRMTRMPKAVRFTESILGPRSRTHLGLDVSRLIDGDGQRSDMKFCLNRFYTAFRRRETRARRNIFADENLWSGEDQECPSWPRLRHGRLVKTTCDGRKAKDGGQVDPLARIQELLDQPPLPGLATLATSEIAEKPIAKKLIDASHRAAEEAWKAEEEAQRAAEEEKRREREEIFSKTGGLRIPCKPLITPVSEQFMEAVEKTLRSCSTRILAKTGDGSDLRQHDFASVVLPTQWLNDEIINGSLIWLDKAINEAAGIRDVKKQTRKCLAMNSFFFKSILSQGPCGTDRKLRRCGVNKSNMLDVDTIILPICDDSHWTVLVVCPRKRIMAHVDSLNPQGSSRFIALGLAWLKDILQEKFDESEWKVVRPEAPRQTNGYDCGVFTITNAMCLVLGLSPIHSYTANDMALQRVRIAGMLLNGGFTDDFDLGVY